MSSTTKTKRVATIKRASTTKPTASVKPTKLAAKKKPLTVADPVQAVRFGSVGENSMIYLQEGVDHLISELQVAIATKEAAKKNALKQIQTFIELPVTSTMSEIRERLNATVSTLQDVLKAM